MRKHTKKTRMSKNGMALLLVVAMVAILTPVILHFNTTSLGRLRIAVTVSGRAQAKYLAEGGILLALYTFSHDQRPYFFMPSDNPLRKEILGEPTSDFEKELLWIDDSVVTPQKFGDGTISIKVTDEAGKISLNRADINLIAGAIQSAGMTVTATSEIFKEEKDVDMSREMAAVIIDWRDRDENAFPGIGAETSWYSSQTPKINSKNSFIETLGELSLLRYFSETDLNKLNLDKIFTVTGTSGRINMNTASPQVIKAIPGIYGSGQEDVIVSELVTNRPFKSVNEVRNIISTLSSSAWTKAGRYIGVTSKRLRVSVTARVNNVDATITTIIEKRGTKFASLLWKEY